ncbi:MAG: ABC transporter permease, partial [Planctomycetota bacterium]
MNLWRLVKKSLGFYWRTNLGVLLAVTVSTAVLTGALVVGDSVRHSLMMMVDARLGATQLALVSQNRFFGAALADELSDELNIPVASVLRLRGMIANSDGTRLANRIEVLGVDERFFEIGANKNAEPFWRDWTQGIVLNEPLAERLGVGPGDEVKLRIEKPGLMPREVPLTPDSDLSVLLRPTVQAVAGKPQFGRFSLQANQIAPLNVFVPIQQWRLADAGIELRTLDRQKSIEMRSSRIFIDDSISTVATDAADGAVGILTYFVNELRVGERTTPYSTVAAVAPADGRDSLIPPDMLDGEILINQWLADDLQAKAGDSIEISYFVVGPMRKLVEKKSTFTIRKILPMEGPAVDPELMPDFPGLADADNCRDWEPGIDIDLDKIHEEDEAYWDEYRGTPKAFITLKAGQAIWANRYGDLTAVRYPVGDNAREKIERTLLGAVNPASLGLFFRPVRQLGTKAGAEGTY